MNLINLFKQFCLLLGIHVVTHPQIELQDKNNDILLINKRVNPMNNLMNLETSKYSSEFLFEFGFEHNLKLIFESNEGSNLQIFKTSKKNYRKYMYTFNSFFEIYDDQNIQLILPDYDENVYTEPWHLDRIVNRELNDNNKFNKSMKCLLNNTSIKTYVIDTGIDIKHPELEGRAKWGGNFVDNINTDQNNHGTFCGGLVGSKTYGVCKNSNLIAVKVLNKYGSGSISSVISGLNYVLKEHLKSKDNIKSVVSMSLGGSKNKVLDQVIEKMLNIDNLFIIVAAGNENQDSCDTSPANVQDVISVMASDKYDARAYFSNYGKCNSIYSPGVDIISIISNNKTSIMSGTSMSTPIVAGLSNYYLSRYPNITKNNQLKKFLENICTKNVILNNEENTNNLLAFLR